MRTLQALHEEHRILRSVHKRGPAEHAYISMVLSNNQTGQVILPSCKGFSKLFAPKLPSLIDLPVLHGIHDLHTHHFGVVFGVKEDNPEDFNS